MKLDIKQLFEKKIFTILILFFSFQLPSIRVLTKYIPHHLQFVILIFLLGCGIFYYLLISPKNFVSKLSTSPVLTVLLILSIIIVCVYLYPIADNLKIQHKGSDQDDAIIVVAKSLFSGHSPYAVRTYQNSLPTPGPGLVILMSPFALLNVYFLAMPFFICLISGLIYYLQKSFKSVNLFLLLVCSSPAFWELTIQGSDLLIIGILIVTPLFLWKNYQPIWLKLLILLLISFILTSRIIFVYLAPIYGFLFAKSESKFLWSFLKYTIIIALFTISIHCLFYFLDPPNYTPLHIWRKGHRIMSSNMFMGSILFFIGLIIITIRTLKINSLKMNIFITWLWVAIPMFFISLISISFRKYNVSIYPISFLGLQMPIISVFFALTLNRIRTN